MFDKLKAITLADLLVKRRRGKKRELNDPLIPDNQPGQTPPF